MNHLSDLLDDISSEAPIDHLDLDDVIGAARSRVRRRRVVAGIAAAAVVSLTAAVVIPGDGGSEQAPAEPPQVSVLTLDDAVEADASRDYRVLHQFMAHSTDQEMSGAFVRGVLPNGTVVLSRYENGPGGPTEIVLVEPDGDRAVAAPAGVVNYLGATDNEIVFGSDNRGLWVLGIADLRWRHILEHTDVSANQTVQPLTGSDGHVYIAASAWEDQEARTIYDVDLAAGRATEFVRGGDVAAYGGRVAWTDAYDAPVRTVTVQDQPGGSTSFDPNTGDCVGKGIGITSQRVVLMTNCNDGAGDSEYTDVITRVDVFDLDGNPVVRITDDDDAGPLRMTDRFLTLSTWSEEQEGTYTFDLETERFLRVTKEMSGLAGNETGVGSTVVWEERLDGETGATYVVAEMR